MTCNLEKFVQGLQAGQIRPTQVVKEALAKIDEHQNLNIFIEVFKEQALAQAEVLEVKLNQNQTLGRLAGVVFCVKDNFLYKDTTTTAAAPFLTNFIAPYTASCLQKLLAEDAILLGKTNLDAFAHGTSTENSYFGPTKHPHQSDLTPGGSSGGSAVAVALDICPFSLGTDTGGSVRLPASFCGVVGFKPTYGLLSRYGVVAMASSTDCISPLAQNVDDVRYLMQILKGQDALDGTTFESSALDFLNSSELPALKIGVIKELNTDLEPTVTKNFKNLLDKLTASGWQVEEVSIPNIKLALACYYVLVSAEISSNLSRYDGLRFGQQLADDDWQKSISQSRYQGFMAENKRRIMLGTYVLSQGYYEAYYQRAQKLRTILCQEFDRALGQYDCLLSPTSPTLPFALGSRQHHPVQMYAADLMTVAPSLAGIPAVSLPLPSQSLPIGVQIMTPQKSDDLTLKIAQLMEAIL